MRATGGAAALTAWNTFESCASIPDKVAAVLPEDVNAMRTFDVVPVIRLQSNQHRIELPIVIKRLFSQRNSFKSWS